MEFSTQELAKYLRTIRESIGYSIYDVNKLCDISPSYLSLMENGKRRPSPIILKKLSSIYHIDYNDLLIKAGFSELVEDEKKDKYVTAEQWQDIDELGNPVAHIPLVGAVKAGYNYLAQENWIGTVDVEKSLVGDGKDYFALKVKGDSMAPVFVENDIVIIKKQNDCENNEFAVVIINGDEGTLKKIKKTDNGIILQPLNPAYGPVMYTKEEMETIPIVIVGVVKQLKREF